MQRRTQLVRLFEDEPDLLRHVPAAEAAAARDRVVVEAITVAKGEAPPPILRADSIDLGFLVLDGVALRRVDFFGRRSVELLGRGDIIRPWRSDEHPTSLPCTPSWKVCEPVRLALLDRRFEREAARLEGVTAELMERLARRCAALSVQLAIAQLPRLDTRLLCLFWRMAERWGTVGVDGTALALRLSQETLAELVSARRASVNVALRDLGERDLLLRPSPGRWLLRGEPPVEWQDMRPDALTAAG